MSAEPHGCLGAPEISPVDLPLEDLWAEHEQATRGLILQLSRNNAVADIIFSNLGDYLLIRKKSVFDPARGTFHKFVGHWARIHIRRYYARLARDARRAEKIRRLGPQDSSVSDDPVAHLDRPQMSRELLGALLENSSPHKALALLVREVGADARAVPMKPAQIVAELSDVPLGQLLEGVVDACAETSWREVEEVRADFGPLRATMSLRVGEVLLHPKTRKAHAKLLDRQVGSTTLRVYSHQGSEEDDISRWCWDVERRTVKAVNARGGILMEWEHARAWLAERRQAERNAKEATPAASQTVPTDAKVDAWKYQWLLETVASVPNSLCEVLVTLLGKVADVEGRDWRPRRIVEELSEETLGGLLAKVENTYLHASRLPEKQVRAALEPFHARVREAVPPHIVAKYPQELAKSIVGDTRPRHYYSTGKPLRNKNKKPIKGRVSACAEEVGRWQDAVLVAVGLEVIRARRSSGAPGAGETAPARLLAWLLSDRSTIGHEAGGAS